jgi:hypothetical protein
MKQYALTEDPNFVLDTESGSHIPVTGTWQSDLYQQWLDAGNTPDPSPSPTFADYVAQFTPGLSQWVEDVAHSNDYDSSLSCVSYKDSSVHQFQQDAVSFIAWRDALWVAAAAYQVGQNGQLPNPMPTLEQVKALMPQPEDHGWVVHAKGVIISAQAPVEQTA